MTLRTAARPRLNLVPRQVEDTPTDRSPPAARWFYIVDLEATATESPHALQDGRVVLGLSATDADANAAVAFDGLGVVYYAELSETEQQDMVARIDNARRNDPERTEAPKTNRER